MAWVVASAEAAIFGREQLAWVVAVAVACRGGAVAAAAACLGGAAAVACRGGAKRGGAGVGADPVRGGVDLLSPPNKCILDVLGGAAHPRKAIPLAIHLAIPLAIPLAMPLAIETKYLE